MSSIWENLEPVENKKDDLWSNLEPVKEKQEEEGLAAGVGRGLVRSVARVLEFGLGLPGDLAMLGVQAERGIRNAIGKPHSPKQEEALAVASKFIPTSSSLRSANAALTGGYTEPKGSWEEKSDEIIQDFAALRSGQAGGVTKLASQGIKALAPGLKSTLRTLGIVGTGQAAKEGSGLFTKDERTKDQSKMGAEIFASLIRPRSAAKEFASARIKASKELIPKGTMVDPKKLRSDVSEIRLDLEKGLGADVGHKSKALKSLEAIEKKVQGHTPLDEILDIKVDLNDKRREVYNEIETSLGRGKDARTAARSAKRNYDRLAKAVDEEIAAYGVHNEPFYKMYKEGNKGYAAAAQSEKIRDFVGRSFGKTGKLATHGGAIGAAHLAMNLFNPHAIIPAAGLAGTTYLGLKSAQILSRIAKSKVMREYYLNTVKAAANENKYGVLHNMAKLESALQADMRKNRISESELVEEDNDQ